MSPGSRQFHAAQAVRVEPIYAIAASKQTLIAQLAKDCFSLTRFDVEMARDPTHSPAFLRSMQKQERLEMRYRFYMLEHELAHIRRDEVIGHRRPRAYLIASLGPRVIYLSRQGRSVAPKMAGCQATVSCGGKRVLYGLGSEEAIGSSAWAELDGRFTQNRNTPTARSDMPCSLYKRWSAIAIGGDRLD